MKKFLSLAMAVLFAGSAVALDNVPKAGASFQANVGFNITNISGLTMNPKVGANVGLKFEYMLPNAYGTYLNAGVNWTQKGARITTSEIIGFETPSEANPDAEPTPISGDVTNKLQSHYLEIPIHVGYRYNISKNLGVYGEVGPYFATGVTGKYKKIYDDDEIDTQHRMLFKKDAAELFVPQSGITGVRVFQRFDCGFGFRVGVEYNNQYSLNLGGDWGFTDMYTKDYRKAFKEKYKDPIAEAKNFNFTVTFGYRF